MQGKGAGEDLRTEHLTLVYLPGAETPAWRVERSGLALGMLAAAPERGGLRLSCRMADRAAQQEALAALADRLFCGDCPRLTMTVPTESAWERTIAERMGWRGVAFGQTWDERGRLVSYGTMALSRENWYPLGRREPFPDVEEIAGPVLDLHCTCVLAAKPERGDPAVYCFEITEHGRWNAFGRVDLRLGYDRDTCCSGNLGYGLQELHRGHGYAAEACRMLRPLIARHGMRRVIITSRPDNAPSRGTCRQLGARLVRVAALPEDSTLYRGGEREICVYHWLPEENP